MEHDTEGTSLPHGGDVQINARACEQTALVDDSNLAKLRVASSNLVARSKKTCRSRPVFALAQKDPGESLVGYPLPQSTPGTTLHKVLSSTEYWNRCV